MGREKEVWAEEEIKQSRKIARAKVM